MTTKRGWIATTKELPPDRRVVFAEFEGVPSRYGEITIRNGVWFLPGLPFRPNRKPTAWYAGSTPRGPYVKESDYNALLKSHADLLTVAEHGDADPEFVRIAIQNAKTFLKEEQK